MQLRTTIFLAVPTLLTAVSASNKFFEPLRFSEKGIFQISVFNDLHFGESKLG